MHIDEDNLVHPLGASAVASRVRQMLWCRSRVVKCRSSGELGKEVSRLHGIQKGEQETKSLHKASESEDPKPLQCKEKVTACNYVQRKNAWRLPRRWELAAAGGSCTTQRSAIAEESYLGAGEEWQGLSRRPHSHLSLTKMFVPGSKYVWWSLKTPSCRKCVPHLTWCLRNFVACWGPGFGMISTDCWGLCVPLTHRSTRNTIRGDLEYTETDYWSVCMKLSLEQVMRWSLLIDNWWAITSTSNIMVIVCYRLIKKRK